MKLLEIENKEAALKKLQCSVQEAEICIEETKRQLDDESARLETEVMCSRDFRLSPHCDLYGTLRSLIKLKKMTPRPLS